MSVMSVGKMPKALVRSLGAGNSRAGRGKSRMGDPGVAASRSDKRSGPGAPVAAQPGVVGPPRPRAAARKPPARPRLWVVPDAAAPDAAVPEGAAPYVAGPKVVVPRPRVPADDQVPARPRSTRPAGAPSRTRVVRSASVPVRRAPVRRAPVRRVPVQQVRRTRLTRRGRRVVWAFAVLLLVAVLTPVLLALASGAQAANHGLPASAVQASMRHIVVKPGQSLWSIALNAEPQADPRTVSQQIIEYNALGSQVVVPGESLWVPQG
jgi:hypothetical protein